LDTRTEILMIIKFDTSSVGGRRKEDMRDGKKTHDLSSGGRSKEAVCSNLNKDAVSWLQKMASRHELAPSLFPH
jgi:hypothetical protein